ncbi:hypothetical protein HYW20_07090 [Candidatus Woesearchaeota archaeon]|nr:hypothetical protein [Candidatus Woesearchaeota archaeon]
MKKSRYLGKEILINNFLFLLSIPIAMISSYLFESEGLYGGLGEAIMGFIVANIAILLYLTYKIRDIVDYGVRFSYILQSSVFLFL